MTIPEEIQRVQELSRSMIASYVAWGTNRKWGETQNTFYSDVTDFVNFRIETADSCLDLIANGKVADALGLCRSLLEHNLLLKLICRGDRYVRLQNLESKSPTEIRNYLAEQQRDLEQKHARGEDLACLYVEEYPRQKKCLMYVFEGLSSNDEPDFRIPIHFFQFQGFRPSTMRLKDEEYFDYYEPPKSVTEAKARFRREAAFSYRHYLSYDALLQCLQINGLVDSASLARIEAHYTFLGSFLHPTHGAARELHEGSNVHSADTAVGMEGRYTVAAKLLAYCYVAFLLAGTLEEVALLFEEAPERYVSVAATADLSALAGSVPDTVNYFWFVDNEAPLYDRFNHAIHHVSGDELTAYGGYAGVPTEAIKFEADVYSSFEHRLTGWHNQSVGRYEAPLGH